MTEKLDSSTELTSEMLVKLGTFLLTLPPEFVDLSKLNFYDKEFNKWDDSIPVSELEKVSLQTLRAIDLATDYHYVASRFAAYAHIEYDKTAAIIFINEAPALLKLTETKETDTSKQKAIDKHQNYIDAKNRRDAWVALRDYLDKRRDSFVQKHYWVKKKFDQVSGSIGSS